MALAVTEASFDRDVIELSRKTPVVVDFWAEWCGPCKALSPALEAAEASRGGRVLLAKIDVDGNQALAGRYGVQGIPAVKAFRDGKVVDEFVGAVPPAKVEQFFDSLVPSRADELLAAGDELSLREAAELEPRRADVRLDRFECLVLRPALEPRRADVAVELGRKRLERGAEDEALEAVESHVGDFAAEGIAARIRLVREGIGKEAFAALDRGERDAALDGLLDELATAAREPATDGAPEDIREFLRRAVVGILSELDPAEASARDYRRKLAAALG
jgi:putative thioredoxin